jgi:serine/threonine protein kinase
MYGDEGATEASSSGGISKGTTLEINGATPSTDAVKESDEAKASLLPAVEDYEFLDLIGEGGMGKVYGVRDPKLNRFMALKVLHSHRTDPAVVSRFIEEAQVTAQLQHPGIVPVHQLGKLEDGRIFFTMPEVNGETLSAGIADLHEASADGEWRAGNRGWTLRRLLSVFSQICDAVAYAHSREFIHRDLKPSNIMMGAHGEVRVLDWGIAKVLGSSPLESSQHAFRPITTSRSESEDHTSAGAIIGTLNYMAPEQVSGNAEDLDARCDVFALGAVLYQILTGSAPFKGNGMAIMYARSKGPPSLADNPSGKHLRLPDGLAEICERAMALNREDRHPNAGALGRATSDWLDGVVRRERAMQLTAQAEERFTEAAALNKKADHMACRGDDSLKEVPRWAPEARKAPE